MKFNEYVETLLESEKDETKPSNVLELKYLKKFVSESIKLSHDSKSLYNAGVNQGDYVAKCEFNKIGSSDENKFRFEYFKMFRGAHIEYVVKKDLEFKNFKGTDAEYSKIGKMISKAFKSAEKHAGAEIDMNREKENLEKYMFN